MRLPPTNHLYVSVTAAGVHRPAVTRARRPTSRVPLMTGILTLTIFFGRPVAGGGVGGAGGAVTAAVGAEVAAALPRPATEPSTVTVIVLPTSAAVGAYVGAFGADGRRTREPLVVERRGREVPGAGRGRQRLADDGVARDGGWREVLDLGRVLAVLEHGVVPVQDLARAR